MSQKPVIRGIGTPIPAGYPTALVIIDEWLDNDGEARSTVVMTRDEPGNFWVATVLFSGRPVMVVSYDPDADEDKRTTMTIPLWAEPACPEETAYAHFLFLIGDADEDAYQNYLRDLGQPEAISRLALESSEGHGVTGYYDYVAETMREEVAKIGS